MRHPSSDDDSNDNDGARRGKGVEDTLPARALQPPRARRSSPTASLSSPRGGRRRRRRRRPRRAHVRIGVVALPHPLGGGVGTGPSSPRRSSIARWRRPRGTTAFPVQGRRSGGFSAWARRIGAGGELGACGRLDRTLGLARPHRGRDLGQGFGRGRRRARSEAYLVETAAPRRTRRPRSQRSSCSDHTTRRASADARQAFACF